MARPGKPNKKSEPYHYHGATIRPTKAGSYQADLRHKNERWRQTFPTRETAEGYIDEIVDCIERRQRPLSLIEIQQARQAFELLPGGVTLPEVVNEYLDRHGRVAEKVRVTEAAQRYLDARIKKGLRPDSIRGTRPRINKVANTFPDALISDISMSDLAGLLDDLGVEGQTYNNYRADWRAWFNWLMKHELVGDNPAARLDERFTEDEMPEFFPVPDVRNFFTALEEKDTALIPYFALSFFTGIRSAELCRMTSDLVTPELIRVTPEKAKKRQMRHITPNPTLVAWLEAYPPADGPIRIPNHKNRASIVRKSIPKFQWRQNGGRRSFATYDFHLHQDAPRTAFILGHKDVQLLYERYRGLTTQEQAKAYFQILPKG